MTIPFRNSWKRPPDEAFSSARTGGPSGPPWPPRLSYFAPIEPYGWNASSRIARAWPSTWS